MKKWKILLADDDPEDREIIRDAMEMIDAGNTIRFADNGEHVLQLLAVEYDMGNIPCLIVLDLNMPVMNGKEVLLWLKERDEYKHIPVMIFTTSSREDDIKLCQKHNCIFFRKPTLYRDLLHVASTMLQLCEKSAV